MGSIAFLMAVTMASMSLAAPISDGNVASQEGTIVTYNVAGSDSVTTKWFGLLGNVSDSMVGLGDSGDNMFVWSYATPEAVYASTDSSFNFGNITTDFNISDIDATHSFDHTDSDSVTNTYTETGCSAGNTINGALGVTTLEQGGSESAFKTCVANDGNGAYVYGVDVVEGGATDYHGGSSEYQMMVPHLDGGTYYMYVEL